MVENGDIEALAASYKDEFQAQRKEKNADEDAKRREERRSSRMKTPREGKSDEAELNELLAAYSAFLQGSQQ